jgi:hypothetical protein
MQIIVSFRNSKDTLEIITVIGIWGKRKLHLE